ncbi:hypothetical protein LX32DRAFT_353956 [Colletotrichum zoysiae]|uniref:Uncharacterized protein n=1 Tax=Colletotrichum zoysiae TaxID=1216348 RepID=A0AAD9HJI9_9PEZI|nr:hypothetical protein LX32DRAFT_353956 [Colletotrichum zoysiae]
MIAERDPMTLFSDPIPHVCGDKCRLHCKRRGQRGESGVSENQALRCGLVMFSALAWVLANVPEPDHHRKLMDVWTIAKLRYLTQAVPLEIAQIRNNNGRKKTL